MGAGAPPLALATGEAVRWTDGGGGRQEGDSWLAGAILVKPTPAAAQ